MTTVIHFLGALVLNHSVGLNCSSQQLPGGSARFLCARIHNEHTLLSRNTSKDVRKVPVRRCPRRPADPRHGSCVHAVQHVSTESKRQIPPEPCAGQTSFRDVQVPPRVLLYRRRHGVDHDQRADRKRNFL